MGKIGWGSASAREGVVRVLLANAARFCQYVILHELEIAVPRRADDVFLANDARRCRRARRRRCLAGGSWWSSGGQPSFKLSQTLRVFDGSGEVVGNGMMFGPRVCVFGLKLRFVHRYRILADDADLGYAHGVQLLGGILAHHTGGPSLR